MRAEEREPRSQRAACRRFCLAATSCVQRRADVLAVVVVVVAELPRAGA